MGPDMGGLCTPRISAPPAVPPVLGSQVNGCSEVGRVPWSQTLAPGLLWYAEKKAESLKGSAIILQDNNTIIKNTLRSPFSC